MGTLARLLLCLAIIGIAVAERDYIQCKVGSSDKSPVDYDCKGDTCVYYKNSLTTQYGCGTPQTFPFNDQTLINADNQKMFQIIYEVYDSARIFRAFTPAEPLYRNREGKYWNAVFKMENMQRNVCYKSQGRELYICDFEGCNLRCDANAKMMGLISFAGCLIAWIMRM